MTFRVYNSLHRKKEDFKPISEGKVGLYHCGPTVYNYAHVGNFRAYMFEDLLKRFLKFKNYSVLQVMNITDVDDKIIRKCYESGEDLKEYTQQYVQAFFDDLDILNIDKPDVFPAATEHINEMVILIKSLLDKGLAYRAEDGNIFYKINAFADYGKLQNLDRSQMKQGKRVDSDEYDKESAHDFALWKAYKPEDGKVFWETELGKGRPGWHIECSAMSMKYLGETFDIHTGGVDNLFPHHENEIAQSEGATGKRFVNYWMHCEHLLWGKTKMSKSLGNIIYLKGLLEKGYSAESIRYTLLSTHYRQKLNFSLEMLDSSEKTLKRIKDFLYEIEHTVEGAQNTEIEKANKDLLMDFEKALDDDLNISPALAALFEYIRTVNKIRLENDFTAKDKESVLETLKRIDTVLAVIFTDTDEQAGADKAWIESKIEERIKARQEKRWADADAIRDELVENKVELLDRPDGKTEYRII